MIASSEAERRRFAQEAARRRHFSRIVEATPVDVLLARLEAATTLEALHLAEQAIFAHPRARARYVANYVDRMPGAPAERPARPKPARLGFDDSRSDEAGE